MVRLWLFAPDQGFFAIWSRSTPTEWADWAALLNEVNQPITFEQKLQLVRSDIFFDFLRAIPGAYYEPFVEWVIGQDPRSPLTVLDLMVLTSDLRLYELTNLLFQVYVETNCPYSALKLIAGESDYESAEYIINHNSRILSPRDKRVMEILNKI